ncbi:MAG: SRPBCC domain-containing protein [Sphingobacteriia bacterium]|nr:SRPBCC domain-containing protein [Sphingobacteriia bacterium]
MSRTSNLCTHVMIGVPRELVWLALTSPEIIKRYLPSSTFSTSWRPGEPIVRTGSQGGPTYRDKGIVLKYNPPRELSYSYWPSRSGLADLPENYQQLTFLLEEQGEVTYLKCSIENAGEEEMSAIVMQDWKMNLARLKILLEDSTELSAY